MPRTHKSQHAAKKRGWRNAKGIQTLYNRYWTASLVYQKEDIYYSSKESEKDKGLGFPGRDHLAF